MRILSLAVGVSAGVHAAVVAWLVLRAPGPRPVGDEPAATPIEIVTVEPARPAEPPPPPEAQQAIDLQLPPSEPEPQPPDPQQPEPTKPRRSQPPQPPDAPIARPAAHSAAITAVAPPAPAANDTATTAAGPPADREHKHSVYLSMRTGEPSSEARPFGRWDVDHPPPGTDAKAPVKPSGLLFSAGGGTFQHHESVFDATIHPDGTVAITDTRNLNVHIALPTPKTLGRAVADWYTSDKGAYGAEGDTSAGRQIQVSAGATATVKDPVTLDTQDHTTTVIVPVFAGGFDITDWLMRNHKQDPYDRRKLKFLDATRDERVEMGARDRSERLAHTAQFVLKNLEAIWSATSDVAARKQALFELWDDCVETGDPAVVEAGAAARRMIIGFIRGRLPAGSAGAYTPAELAALARTKHSSAAFQPYE